MPGDLRQVAEAALREHGFEPQAVADGTIPLGNCPFRQLAVQHTEIICGMNLALIQGVAEGIDPCVLHPARDPRPGDCCVVTGTSQPEFLALAGASG